MRVLKTFYPKEPELQLESSGHEVIEALRQEEHGLEYEVKQDLG